MITCDKIETVKKNSNVFETPFIRVDVDEVRFPDGKSGEYSIIHQGDGAGAVAIPFYTYRGIGYIGLTRQYRYPLGSELFEFPRGGTSDFEQEEATREVEEEMGFTPTSMLSIGDFHPDSGVLSMKIRTWVAFANIRSVPEEHIEEETGLRALWVSESTFEGMILTGKITCGVTLAAYALFRSKRATFGHVIA